MKTSDKIALGALIVSLVVAVGAGIPWAHATYSNVSKVPSIERRIGALESAIIQMDKRHSATNRILCLVLKDVDKAPPECLSFQ